MLFMDRRKYDRLEDDLMPDRWTLLKTFKTYPALNRSRNRIYKYYPCVQIRQEKHYKNDIPEYYLFVMGRLKNE